jgi:ornithine cyclodeaminase
MPSTVTDKKHGDVLGLKLVSVRPDNVQKQLPTVPSNIVLLSAETGLAQAFIAGTFLTALRTAAGSGVATNLLCKKDGVKVLTVFGAGAQAEQHIIAMFTARPSITHVFIVNRTVKNAVKLGKKMQARFRAASFGSIAISDTEQVKLAVTEADLICCTTNSSTPLFQGKWLNPAGCHLNLIGSYTPSMREVDSDTIGMASVLVVDTHHATESSGDILIPLEEKVIDITAIKELGEVLSNSATTQPVEEAQITIFKSAGTAVQDMVTAKLAVDSAIKLGLGQTLVL